MSADQRIYSLNNKPAGKGPVLYWMSRDQRAEENPALDYAIRLCSAENKPLLVVFCLDPSYPMAYFRHMDFLLRGLHETAQTLDQRGISFLLMTGHPVSAIREVVAMYKPGWVITDFDPLRIKMQWKSELAKELSVSFAEVDAHNVVPARFVSQKAEFGAYTLRPKMKRLLPLFLQDEDRPVYRGTRLELPVARTPMQLLATLGKREVMPVAMQPGTSAAKEVCRTFIAEKLAVYNEQRNDPNRDVLSGLSPYLHFGQVSAAWVAREVLRSAAADDARDAFLEELLVRRELSDNYCLYQPLYDRMEGLPGWAKNELELHRRDEREYVYTTDAFETSATHDPLWNAAQRQMVTTGKMHGYMRMYWAKKILEWTATPEDAFKTAIFLNDKYSLDGRDPNGYAGIAWAIGGLHDRAWASRPVFGKIRYMNDRGCRRKFNVDQYISTYAK